MGNTSVLMFTSLQGSGSVRMPSSVFFLPQKSFMPLGSLRHQLLFPTGEGTKTCACLGPIWLHLLWQLVWVILVIVTPHIWMLALPQATPRTWMRSRLRTRLDPRAGQTLS